MKSNTLAIALASLLVGGVAVAAFQSSRDVRKNILTPHVLDELGPLQQVPRLFPRAAKQQCPATLFQTIG